MSVEHGLPAPLERWTAERDRIYEQVMDQGFHASRKAFVQHYDTDVLDAALLRMPTVGFIAGTDPRWLSTLEAMDEELVTDSLVYRYDPDASPDGLRGSEGTFSLCSFAYVDALTRAGRIDDARTAFEKMLTYANHVGLYSEEIALTGEQIGNFPQAFTHLSLIDAATGLDAALDRQPRRPRDLIEQSVAHGRTGRTDMTSSRTDGISATQAAGAVVLPLALAQFICSFAGSNMNVAISTIADDLGTSVTGIQTTITLFTLTMAALMIPGSKLTDIWGRKVCFIAGLVVYGAGALLAAVAQNLTTLTIGYSLLEGIGSALLIPPIYILVTVLFDDLSTRAKYFGVVSGAAGIGAAAGPLIGGLITSYISWRASFLVQVLVVGGDRAPRAAAGRPAPAGAAAELRPARRRPVGGRSVLRRLRDPADRDLRLVHRQAGLQRRRHRGDLAGRDLAGVAVRGDRRRRPRSSSSSTCVRGRRAAGPRSSRSACSATGRRTSAC